MNEHDLLMMVLPHIFLCLQQVTIFFWLMTSHGSHLHRGQKTLAADAETPRVRPARDLLSMGKKMGELRGPKNRYQATAFFGDRETIYTHLYFVSPFVDYCIGVFRSKTPAMDCGILNKYSVTGLVSRIPA